MSKNSLPSSACDVRFDIREDGTKYIVRKFDMPFRKGYRPKTSESTSNGKYMFQHEVPEGKIVLKQAHPYVISKEFSHHITKVKSATIPQPIDSKLQLTTTQKVDNTSNIDIPIIKCNEQTVKVLNPLQSVPNTECIKVRNVPENLKNCSAYQTVSTMIVNGKKVVLIKPLKDADKKPNECKASKLNVAGESVINSDSETKQVLIKIDKQQDAANTQQFHKAFIPLNEMSPDLDQLVAESEDKNKIVDISNQRVNGCNSSEYVVNTVCSEIPILFPASDLRRKPVHLTIMNNQKIENACDNERTSQLHQLQLYEGVTSLKNGVCNHNTVTSPEKAISNSFSVSLDSPNAKVSASKKQGNNETLQILNDCSSRRVINDMLHIESLQKGTELLESFFSLPSIPNINPHGIKGNEMLLDLGEASNVPQGCTNNLNENQPKKSPVSVDSNLHCKESNIVVINTTPGLDKIGTLQTKILDLRKKSAFQFLEEAKKDKIKPRKERIIDIPARRVKVVDSSTQTNLLSLWERGRMVEITLENVPSGIEANSSNLNIKYPCTFQSSYKQINNQDQTSNTNMQFSSEPVNLDTGVSDSGGTLESEDPPFSKRIRLDERSSSLFRENDKFNQSAITKHVLAKNMNLDLSHTSVCKENTADAANNNQSSANSQNSAIKNDLINISSQIPMQTTNECPVNSIENNVLGNFVVSQEGAGKDQRLYKIVHEQLYKDFCGSLVQDENGNLPIHNAVIDGHYKQVKRQCLVLIAQKKSVDIRNEENETPLHLAVLCHEKDIVALLLQHKAKPDVPNKDGNTPLHMAVRWGNTDIFKLLLNSIKDGSPSLNKSNEDGYTPLHLCALYNKTEEAYLLVIKQAKLNIRDKKSGRTALFHAVENNYSEISRTLVKFGASPNIANFAGQTPLNASEFTHVLDKLNCTSDSSQARKDIDVSFLCSNGRRVHEQSDIFSQNNIGLTKSGILSSNIDCNMYVNR